MSEAETLGRAIDDARPLIQQVKESADAVVPPLGPATRSTLDRVLYLEERLLVHATSAQALASRGTPPRAAEAMVEAYMLGRLASYARIYHERLRELLAEDVRDLPGAQPTRRLRKLQKQERANERWRRDFTVRLLRREADMIEEVLDS